MLASFLFLFNNTGKFNINDEILLAQTYIFPRNKKIIKSDSFSIYLAIAKGDFHDYYYENDNIVFVGDYSIYNKEELLNLIMPETFDSKTIPEIFIALFKKFGKEFIKYVDGDYSFVIFDKFNLLTFVYRDRIGVRPVYYFSNTDFIISNELRLIYSIKKSDLSFNKDEFLNTILTIPFNKDSTVYKEIKRLPPSSYLVYDNKNLIIGKYWELEIGKYIVKRDENEYFNIFKNYLINCIEKRCDEGNILGSELSGGLDSSVITSVANNYVRKVNKVFYAFSNVFPIDKSFKNLYDERRFIDIIIKNNNINWIPIDNLKWNYIELLKFAVDIQGIYLRQNFSTFNIGTYEAAYIRNVSVLLSGFGGDELVSSRPGIPWLELLENKDYKRFFVLLDKFPKAKLPFRFSKILFDYLLYKIFNKRPKYLNISRKNLNKRFSALALDVNLVESYNLKRKFMEYSYQKIPIYIDHKQLFKITQPYISERLESSYILAAQYGVEYRYPLLDYKLIQLYFSFPWWVRESVECNRYLFRQSIINIVPEETRLRKDKAGLIVPHAFVLFNESQQYIKKFLFFFKDDNDIRKIFDIEKMIKWLDMLFDKDCLKNKMYSAFNVYLSIILWLNNNKNLWKNHF